MLEDEQLSSQNISGGGALDRFVKNFRGKQREFVISEEDNRAVMSVLNIRAKHNIANYDLQLPVEATIKDLSEKILELTGVPIAGQKIIFCGKQLPKDLAQPLTEVRSPRDHGITIGEKYFTFSHNSGRTGSSGRQQDHDLR